jgi:CRP/FNR family transcriptional regulator, nitrogen fixation regulation protein
MTGVVAHVAYRKSSRAVREARSFGFSQALLRDCSQQPVKNSILALRRGPIRYRRNAMIVCEGDCADYVFLVVKGVVRSCRNYQDGSRGIVAFHLPGELFGLTADQGHSLSAEAVTDTLILYFKRGTLHTAACKDARIAKYLLATTTNELRRVQEHSLTLGRLATCRVQAFLTDLSVRMGRPKYLKLPMSLLDIADHLALKMETVSRTIASLEKSGAIVRSSYRTIILRNRAPVARVAIKSFLVVLCGGLSQFAQWTPST